MEWLNSTFIEHSALQSVIVISLVCAIGIALGKTKISGFSLGLTFVFFIGIIAGDLGLSLDKDTSSYAESFGLAIFVYALGVQVGPGFFSSFRTGGLKLNALALGVIVLGTFTAIGLAETFGIAINEIAGVLCGATTNTPALGAAQQALSSMHIDSTTPALGCAATYPLGIIGVIIAIAFMRKIFVPNRDNALNKSERSKTFIGKYQISNPAIFGKSIKETAQLFPAKFVISRLWRNGTVTIPTSDKILKQGDYILAVTSEKNAKSIALLFGEQEGADLNSADIDWDAIDSQLVSQPVLVTRPEINGKSLGSLKLRNLYGINISRVWRAGVQLLATPELTLQLGDKLIVVGEANAVKNVGKILGNTVKNLNEPNNLSSMFFGIFIGLIVGAIPISIPGISLPVKLGLAGGPIIIGILMGRFGPKIHMITYTTESANLMLRALGLSIYLACIGINAGAQFFDIVLSLQGLQWILLGFTITVIPLLIIGTIAIKLIKLDYGTIAGMLCGSMSNPMALNYSNDMVNNESPAEAYATVYPISMFARVIIAQLLILLMV